MISIDNISLITLAIIVIFSITLYFALNIKLTWIKIGLFPTFKLELKEAGKFKPTAGARNIYSLVIISAIILTVLLVDTVKAIVGAIISYDFSTLSSLEIFLMILSIPIFKIVTIKGLEKRPKRKSKRSSHQPSEGSANN